jgi:hypothetical protein
MNSIDKNKGIYNKKAKGKNGNKKKMNNSAILLDYRSKIDSPGRKMVEWPINKRWEDVVDDINKKPKKNNKGDGVNLNLYKLNVSSSSVWDRNYQNNVDFNEKFKEIYKKFSK